MSPDCASAVQVVLDGARRLEVPITSEQADLLVHYCELVERGNTVMNLTAHRSPEAIMRRLVLDSLTILAALPPDVAGATHGLRVLDVGSGVGVPGIPLKVMRPTWSLALVESIGKRARFLEDAVERLGFEDVTVLNKRAEEIGAAPGWHDSADLVVARAVAALPTLLELCAPLVAAGGYLALTKGANAATEAAQAGAAAQALNLKQIAIWQAPEDLGIGSGHIAVYRKTGATPSGYPRRIGLAASRPIGVERRSSG
jgi:16S rRNA (guanine527-N7)-methyltransferase